MMAVSKGLLGDGCVCGSIGEVIPSWLACIAASLLAKC